MMVKKRFLSNPTYEAALIQSRAFRALNNFMTNILSSYKINLSEWKLLGHLNEVGKLTPSEISKVLEIKRSITARLLKSLELKGYVERRKNKQDNRQTEVCITPAGRGLVDQVEPIVRQELRSFLADVPRGDLEAYGQVLAIIARKLN